MPTYEIEIKSLLGSKEKADQLIAEMSQADPNFVSLGSHKQLNHYFIGGDLSNLFENCKEFSDQDKIGVFARISLSNNFSVRTREADGNVLLVIKASVDDTTSSNGTARIEFETQVKNLTLDQLDDLVLKSGFQYQAKWSRGRQDFKFKNLNVSIDKNAGYGYLAEFESLTDDESKTEEIKTVIRDSMTALGIEELPQDRLERMFAYYNQNWQDYYGTEKTFTVD